MQGKSSQRARVTELCTVMGEGAHEGSINIRHFGSQLCYGWGKLERKDLSVTTRQRTGVEKSDSKAREDRIWVGDV
jgi:hypothetical protein